MTEPNACPRCGSIDPAVRLPVAYRVFICNDPWHDRPAGADDLDDEPSMTEKIASLKRIADQLEAGKLALADPHADDPSCPTCGGTKKLLLGDVFMCTDTWHLYRCHCGKPAVRLIRPTVSLDASPWPGIPVCGDTGR